MCSQEEMNLAKVLWMQVNTKITINDKVAEVANNNCPKHKIIQRKNDNIPREIRSLIRTRKYINGNINHLKYVKTVQTELEIKNRDNKVRKLEERKSELENQKIRKSSNSL